MSKIKICGLGRMEDIAAVNRCRPDYIGFVFAKSRRQVTPERARELKSALDAGIQAVGVFVNAPPDEIAALAGEGLMDLVQLHGEEDEAAVRQVKALTGLPVIKALRVDSRESVRPWQDSAADYLLLDNGPGGTGQPFDWSLLPEMHRPYFLAGGLCIENLPEALALSPYCLDVSSGAETGGVKDADKIEQIVRMVRKG